MNKMFTQPSGPVAKQTNKQAIARKFGVKQSEVLYYSQFIALSGYKVIYDKATQKAYSLPTDIPSDAIATNLTQAGVLYYGSTSVDLAALAVQREEYVTLPGSFSTGVAVTTKNELVTFTDGKYRWDGELPKIVPADSTPATTGGVSPSAWMPVGAVAFRKELADTTDVMRGDALVGVKQPFTGSVARTQHDKNKDVISVKDFGAVGDGVTDDTAAIQAAMTYACHTGSISVHIPAGRYVISQQIDMAPATVSSGQNHLYVSVYGDGASTVLLQYVNGPVFSFTGLTHYVSFSDFVCFCKVAVGRAEGNALFHFPDGNSDSHYVNISYRTEGQETTTGACFYVCGTNKYNDTVTFNNCVSRVTLYGYKIGKGSTVYIIGGRVMGAYPSYNSIGLYFTGGNGGCWIWGTDFISHYMGINITGDSGESNREIFLTHGCVDTSNIGLNHIDQSYVSCTGLWAASCDYANVNFAPSNGRGILNIVGGTIFNAGINLADADVGGDYAVGLKINRYGRLQISGVSFRENRNRAISCYSDARDTPAIIDNCNFYNNGTSGVSGSCQVYLAGNTTLRNNTFEDVAGVANVSKDIASQNKMRIIGNVGYMGRNVGSDFMLGASGETVTNKSGKTLNIYLREGSVSSIWVNENPVYAYSSDQPINVMVRLEPMDTLRVNYSAAPSIVRQPV